MQLSDAELSGARERRSGLTVSKDPARACIIGMFLSFANRREGENGYQAA